MTKREEQLDEIARLFALSESLIENGNRQWRVWHVNKLLRWVLKRYGGAYYSFDNGELKKL